MSGDRKFDLGDYIEVRDRIPLFYAAYPEGALMTGEVRMVDADGAQYVAVQAFAYRSPTDMHPGVGWSWMRVPGGSTYTKGSELENTETSAWGRAIAALNIGIGKSIASANEVRAKEVKADVQHGDDGSLIGTVEVGDKASSDYQLRQTPDGPVIGFRLRGDKGGILVRARGDLAVQLDAWREATVGQRVTCWGRIATERFTPKGKGEVTYQVLDAERVRVPEVGDLPIVTEAPSEPMFTEDEQAAIDDALALA